MGRRPLEVEKITPVRVIAETLPDFNSGELTALQDLDTDVSLSEDSEYIPESADTDDDTESNDPNEKCDAAGANKEIENNNHDTTQGKKSRRRRLQYKETWLRNKRKVMRNTGKRYTNRKGAVVAERRMGQPCKCEKKVF